MAYTTSAIVGDYLRTTFDGTTTPTDTVVDRYIDWVESEIDHITKNTYESTVFTNEIIDLNSDTTSTSANSSDATWAYDEPAKWDFINLPYKAVLSVTSVDFNRAGPGETPDWQNVTIGDGGDVKLVGDKLLLLPNAQYYPLKQVASIRVSGTYGDTTVTNYLQKLATYMVALEVMNSKVNEEVSQGGGSSRVGDIEITESSSYTSDFINQTQSRVDEILNKLGTHNTYLI